MSAVFIKRVLKIVPAQLAISSGFARKGQFLSHIDDNVYSSVITEYNEKLNSLLSQLAVALLPLTTANMERFSKEDAQPESSGSESEPEEAVPRKKHSKKPVPVQQAHSDGDDYTDSESESDDEQTLIDKLRAKKQQRKQLSSTKVRKPKTVRQIEVPVKKSSKKLSNIQ